MNAGRKTTLINRIRDRDIVFVTVFQKPLSDINDIFITRLLTDDLDSEDVRNEVICSVENVSVTRQMIRCLATAEAMTDACMRAIMLLFMKRERRLVTAYDDVNGPGRFKNSYFYLNVLAPNTPVPERWTTPYRIYFIERIAGIWVLIAVDCASKYVSICNPCHFTTSNIGADYCDGISTLIVSRVDDILCAQGILAAGAASWPRRHLANYNHFDDSSTRGVDSGILVAMTLYYSVVNCPVAFRLQEVAQLRLTFAYWITDSMLPI